MTVAECTGAGGSVRAAPWYLACFSWALLVITGAGVGSPYPTPYSSSETLVVTVIQFLAAMMWAIIIASFCDLTTNANPAGLLFRQTIDDVRELSLSRPPPQLCYPRGRAPCPAHPSPLPPRASSSPDHPPPSGAPSPAVPPLLSSSLPSLPHNDCLPLLATRSRSSTCLPSLRCHGRLAAQRIHGGQRTARRDARASAALLPPAQESSADERRCRSRGQALQLAAGAEEAPRERARSTQAHAHTLTSDAV